MIDLPLLKGLLNHEAYLECSPRLKRTLFAEDTRELYDTLRAAHDKYGADLSPADMLALWRADNPVATKAEVADMKELVEELEFSASVSPEISKDLVAQLWRRDTGKRIATLGLEVSEGNDEAMAQLTRILENVGNDFMPDDFGEDTTQDIHELMDLLTDEHRFKFNIETLSRQVYGIGPEEFGIVFATPETGKTAFIVSLCVAPGGFVDQGKRVAFIGNEESTKRTVVRAYSAATGLTKEQIANDRDRAMVIYKARTKGMVTFKDTQDWDLDRIEAYIAKKKPDVVVIDQLDKVQIGGAYEKGHERLRELYRRAREMAKRHNCAVIGVSQASNDANNKTRLDYSMMEGSKIGKAAEADLIIGIGKHSGSEDDDPDNSRFLTVSKNKLSGWHGTIIANIQPEVSRYVE